MKSPQGWGTYDWISRNRLWLCAVCRAAPRTMDRFRFRDWLIALLLPVSAILVTRHLPPWAFMWGTAFGLGAALKWLCWVDARIHGARPSPSRALGWFVGWAGLDGRAFLTDHIRPPRPGIMEWVTASLPVLVGFGLVVGAFPALFPAHPILAVWVGMIGFAGLFHFGVIRLIALGWRTLGINAQPIMRAPLLSTSLAEFWGRRWNLAFSTPARRFLFLPVGRQWGNGPAMLLVFLGSGLLHELVISLPAGAGYGRPTAYFLIQAAGVAFERTPAARRIGLPGRTGGWLYAAVWLIVPLPLLFPVCFLNSVMTPFLHVLAALFTGGFR
ncbi:MAG: hypothetical protein JNN07_15655 [Verrucomicrobiales bacterium]|nr:hypothetical protein [Verrucomicrobiales bacterium]